MLAARRELDLGDGMAPAVEGDGEHHLPPQSTKALAVDPSDDVWPHELGRGQLWVTVTDEPLQGDNNSSLPVGEAEVVELVLG